MAVSEPYAAQPGYSGPPGTSEPSQAGFPAAKGRVRWWRWALLALGLLLVIAVVVRLSSAAVYQPIQFGGSAGGDFPGMPGDGGRSVNTFAAEQGQIYEPAQRGVFTIVESIVNTGPAVVTIEAVTMVGPQERQGESPSAPAGYPLAPAGQAMWRPVSTGPNVRLPAGCTFGKPCPVAGLLLPPDQDIQVAMPVRFTFACYDTNSWLGQNDFYVQERSGPFTHWVAIGLAAPYIFHDPAFPDTPKQDVTCPR
jgi:hypothetical protein